MKEYKIVDLCKSYGIKKLADGINLSIRTGDHIGLIGPNGTGKSSLLKVIAGIDNYDSGDKVYPNDYTISYLDQNPQLPLELTIFDTLYESKLPKIQLIKAYEEASKALAMDASNEKLQDKFNQLSNQMTEQNAWETETQIRTILTQLQLNEMDKLIKDCSGGERKRVAIAQCLIAEADLLILDEPTNHLDVQSIEWLENYLKQYKGAFLLVTHDRYFLDRSVNQIIELNYGKLTTYQGNYQNYLSERSQREELVAKAQAKENQLFKKELEWMRSGAQARSTKQQARINRFEDLSAQIKNRDSQEQMENFDFSQSRLGNKGIEIENLKIQINNQRVIQDFTYVFQKNDRIGIVGPNGVGKSTFLNTLAGLYSNYQGSIEIGKTVRMAYYKQLNEDLPHEEKIIDYITKIADKFDHGTQESISAAQLLERFQFPRKQQHSKISSLSGGERKRLYLVSLLVQEPNVLMLDEPTNDLDIDTLTILEDYLEHFEGIVLTVSHDRYFLDKVTNKLIDLQGQGNFEFYWGSYSDYLDCKKNIIKERPAKEKEKQTIQQKKKANERKRMTYHEKQEWASIEERIMQAEEKIEQIQEEMINNPADAVLLMELQEELEYTEMNLLEFYERYDYLSNLSL